MTLVARGEFLQMTLIMMMNLNMNKSKEVYENMVRHMILNSIRMYRQEYKEEYGEMNIVGHSEIAPNRKNDPGPFFNWDMINV